MGAVQRYKSSLIPLETITAQQRNTAAGGWTTLANDIVVVIVRITQRGSYRPSYGQVLLETRNLPNLWLVINDSFLIANHNPVVRLLTSDDQIIRNADGSILKIEDVVNFPDEQHIYASAREGMSPGPTRG